MRSDAQPSALKSSLRAGLLLAAFALAGGALLSMTHSATKDRIAENERAWTLRSLNQIIDPAEYDNDLFTDLVRVSDRDMLGSRDPVPVYRARRQDRPVAVIIGAVAPDGYNGDIRLLVGIRADGRLAGVRVASHRETPGLGDAVEVDRSDWILDFDGRSLGDPAGAGWAVRKDGGEFDQFTGATITPRAVVKAVNKALLYFDAHEDTLFSLPAADTGT